MNNYDWVVIGAGVVGLTVARAIQAKYPDASIAIFEKETELGAHASGRNSGVVHAGVYYKAGTLKAKLCVDGARRMREFCQEHGLPFQNWGKIIVPDTPELTPALDTLLQNGKDNGVTLQRMNRKELLEIEPALAPGIDCGVYSPLTSLIDPKAVLKFVSQGLTAKGVSIFFTAPIWSINAEARQIVANGTAYSYGHLVNCAGAYADVIAHRMGIGEEFCILPFKGLYYKLAESSGIRIHGNIYPVPDLRVPFLGVHFTKNVAGDTYVGPTAIPALGKENYHGVSGINFLEATSILSKTAWQLVKNRNGFRQLVRNEIPKLTKSGFFNAARRLVLDLKPEHLKASTKVGIRAQLYNRKTQELEMDFKVVKGPHSTHVLNAVSPAFTSSLTFADHILAEYLP